MNVLDTAMEHGVSYAEANYNINEAIRQNKGISFLPFKYKDGTTAPDDTYLKGKVFVPQVTEIRIPGNVSKVLEDFNNLNN